MVSISTSTLQIQSSLPIWFTGFSSSFPLIKVCEMDEQGWRVLGVLRVRCTSREMQRGRARGEVGIDERKPFGLTTSTLLFWGRSEGATAVSRGCKGGAKYLHREQRKANELRKQQGGFRVWQREKLSEAFQKRVKMGKRLLSWGCVCKTSLCLC